MEKEQNSKTEEKKNNKIKSTSDSEKKEELKEKEVELSPEEKIKELEEKLARTLAEMENQRRRFEKEKDDAFEYGGFSFAREALNLIDNLETHYEIEAYGREKGLLVSFLMKWTEIEKEYGIEYTL